MTDANLFVAVDLPHLTAGFFKYLQSRIRNSIFPVTTCKIGSHYPLCLGVRRQALPDILNLLSAGRRSVHALIETINTDIITEADLLNAGFDVSLFWNINTPEDYSRE